MNNKATTTIEWLEVTLGDITKESAFGPRFSSSLYDDSGNIGTIRTTDLNDEGIINYQTIPYANLPDDNFKSHYLNSGDLLITRSGTCGIPCIFKSQPKPIIAGAFLIRFRLKNNVEPVFLHMLLKSTAIQAKIKRMASGGVQKNLTGTNLKKIKFRFPPLPEQIKIAKILSTWDKAIATIEKLIENSCTHKKALMQQLLTGKKRFAGFEGEWKSVRLDSIANIVMGSSPKSSSYNEIGEGLPLLQGNADINNRKSCPRVFTSQVTKECSVGDILLSVRAPVGTVAISEHRACIGRGISSIKAIQKHSHEYLYQWLLNFEPKWERLSQGSTFEAVNSNDIKSLHLNVPCFKEQQKIASVLTNTDQEIELLEQQLSDLKQEKKALMQQLLTGKRRVTVDMTSETLC